MAKISSYKFHSLFFLLTGISLLLLPFLITPLSAIFNEILTEKINRLLSPNSKALMLFVGGIFTFVGFLGRQNQKKAFQFDLQKELYNYYYKHKEYLLGFFISLGILLIIYGSKIAFKVYNADDYSIIYKHFSTKFFAANSGRWFLAPFTSLFFHNNSLINPYINTIISIFFLTFSAIITTRIWQIKETLSIVLITVFCIGSPFMASNLYFNLNTSVHISFFISSLAMYLFICKKNYIIPTLMLSFMFGTYQTNIQLVLIILAGWYILTLQKSNNRKEIIQKSKVGVIIVSLIAIAYFVNVLVNNAVVNILDTTVQGRFAESKVISAKSIIDTGLKFWLFSPYIGIALINIQFWLLSILIFIFGTLSFVLRSKEDVNLVYYKISLFILTSILCLYTIKLPLLFGMDISTRAIVHLSWFISIFIVLAIQSNVNLFKSFAILLTSIIIIYSTSHISYLYNESSQRTLNDMFIANEIATSIYKHENYSNKEPIKLLLIGENGYKNNERNTNEMFSYFWSKYSGLESFTSLDFIGVDSDSESAIIDTLRNEDLSNFPEKGSIHYINETFVILLNIDEILQEK